MMDAINPNFPSKEELKSNPNFEIKEPGECEGLKAKSYEVSRFSELIYLVSQLSSLNQNHLLLFRGQTQRFPENGKLSFLPTIYRNVNDPKEIKQKFKQLEDSCNKLSALKNLDYVDTENREIIRQSMIQHYYSTLGIGTPLLDMTQSLRVAYSFILENSDLGSGFVYVFGLPHTKGLITKDKKRNLTTIRLLSLSGALTLLPPLQEGYLIQHNTIPKTMEDIKKCDFNQYLIAEIKVTNLGNNSFWRIIPPESLEKNIYDPLKQKIEKTLNRK